MIEGKRRKWCNGCQRGNYINDKGFCQDCGSRLFDIGLDKDKIPKKVEKEISLGGGYTDKYTDGNYTVPSEGVTVSVETEKPTQEQKVVEDRKVVDRKPKKRIVKKPKREGKSSEVN